MIVITYTMGMGTVYCKQHRASNEVLINDSMLHILWMVMEENR